MDRKQLEKRTKQFHIDTIKLCLTLPRNVAGYEISKQLIRSSGSVGANYRASARAKSTPDFINKIQIIIEEADESSYWLEIIRETNLLDNDEVKRLIREANELTAIFTSTNKTLKSKT